MKSGLILMSMVGLTGGGLVGAEIGEIVGAITSEAKDDFHGLSDERSVQEYESLRYVKDSPGAERFKELEGKIVVQSYAEARAQYRADINRAGWKGAGIGALVGCIGMYAIARRDFK